MENPQKTKRLAFVLASMHRATQLLSFFADDAKRADFEVSIFCPDEIYEPLRDFLNQKSITRFQLIRVPQRSGIAIFNHLRYFALLDRSLANEFQERFRLLDFRTSGFFLPYVAWPSARFLRLLPFCRRPSFWNALEVYLFGNQPYYREIFSKHHFDWIVFPGPVLRAMSELQLFVAAKRAHLKIAAVDEAFGQFAVLPVSIRPFDRVFVWNKHTVDQALRYHPISKEAFVIAGPLRFDVYFNDTIPPREQFLKMHRLDPHKRIVSVVLSGVDIEFSIIDRLLERSKREGQGFQLIVRTNPFLSTVGEYVARYADASNLMFIDPHAQVLYEGYTPPQSQMVDLGALLKYSDVVISQASTVAIEGAIFDTPAIYHLFGLSYVEESVTKGRVVRHQEAERRERYDEWPFIAEVLNTGGVPLAGSMDELISMVDEALLKRDALAAERRALVEKICTYTDGRTGERIAQHLKNNVY